MGEVIIATGVLRGTVVEGFPTGVPSSQLESSDNEKLPLGIGGVPVIGTPSIWTVTLD